jgi:adenylylsulfate kinase
MVVWFIGLSASGKTTLATTLAARWRRDGRAVVLLDGDALRDVWGGTLGFSLEDRYENARRISQLCRLLDGQGLDVVAAVLSMFPEWQAWNRRTYSQYVEVFLDVPMVELERRDTKGIYAAARGGRLQNVAGVDLEFPRPQAADLVLAVPEVLEAPGAIVDRVQTFLARIAGTVT